MESLKISFEIQYVLLAILGMAIHILMHITQRKKNENPFSFRTFFSDKFNYIRIVLSITSTFALLLMSDDVANVLGITLIDGSPAKSLFAFLSGYLNHSIIRNVLKMFKK